MKRFLLGATPERLAKMRIEVVAGVKAD